MQSHLAPAHSRDATKSNYLNGVMRRFVHVNRSISERLVPGHLKQITAFRIYRNLAELFMRQPTVKIVLDVGCGPKWKFPAAIKEGFRSA